MRGSRHQRFPSSLLIPIALGLGLLGLAAFFWALGNGQFEDRDGPAVRILIDED